MRTVDPSEFLRTNKVATMIREAMRAVKLPWRPYIFRSYFDTMQMYAEGKGMISHTYSQVFMGHSGDIEATYTLRKAELPAELIEEMRSSYSRLSELLSTRKTGASMSELEQMTRKDILAFEGYTQDEIDQLGNLSEYTVQQLREMSKDKQMKELGLNGHSTQRIVPWSEIEKYVNEGWELVSKISEEKCIIRLPK
jgi:hypothetical protein